MSNKMKTQDVKAVGTAAASAMLLITISVIAGSLAIGLFYGAAIGLAFFAVCALAGALWFTICALIRARHIAKHNKYIAKMAAAHPTVLQDAEFTVLHGEHHDSQ